MRRVPKPPYFCLLLPLAASNLTYLGMYESFSMSYKPITVICTNHLSAEQAGVAWESLLRDILLFRVLKKLSMPTSEIGETTVRQRVLP